MNSSGTPSAPWSAWKILGVAVVVVLALVGLLAVAGFVWLVLAMNSYGSNK